MAAWTGIVIGLSDWSGIRSGIVKKIDTGMEPRLSEWSSVETLLSVPVVNLFPAQLRVGKGIGGGLTLD